MGELSSLTEWRGNTSGLDNQQATAANPRSRRSYHLPDRRARARALVAPPVRPQEEAHLDCQQRPGLGLHRRPTADARPLHRVLCRRVRADTHHVCHRCGRYGRERPRRRCAVRGLWQAEEHQLEEDLSERQRAYDLASSSLADFIVVGRPLFGSAFRHMSERFEPERYS